jgi:hypothetical protein
LHVEAAARKGCGQTATRLPSTRKAFLDTVPGLYRDLYMVWFRTGWRPSEILAVRFDWLDVHRQTVMLRLGRIARWGGVEAPPKTGPREVDCRYDPEIFCYLRATPARRARHRPP